MGLWFNGASNCFQAARQGSNLLDGMNLGVCQREQAPMWFTPGGQIHPAKTVLQESLQTSLLKHQSQEKCISWLTKCLHKFLTWVYRIIYQNGAFRKEKKQKMGSLTNCPLRVHRYRTKHLSYENRNINFPINLDSDNCTVSHVEWVEKGSKALPLYSMYFM